VPGVITYSYCCFSALFFFVCFEPCRSVECQVVVLRIFPSVAVDVVGCDNERSLRLPLFFFFLLLLLLDAVWERGLRRLREEKMDAGERCGWGWLMAVIAESIEGSWCVQAILILLFIFGCRGAMHAHACI
jgi:hypothetical protein